MVAGVDILGLIGIGINDIAIIGGAAVDRPVAGIRDPVSLVPATLTLLTCQLTSARSRAGGRVSSSSVMHRS